MRFSGEGRRRALAVLVAVVLGTTAACGASSSRTVGDAAALTGRRAASPTAAPVPTLPGGRHHVFDGRFLVAYYGTPQTPALGVLGEGDPEQTIARLTTAAAPFQRRGQTPQIVLELIVSVASGSPGGGGDYSHDVPRDVVEPWIAAAHRHGALVVLDLQPGTQDFTRVARRWSWALADPWVGLALDPEWRMHGTQVPGRVFGHTDAAEVDATSAWLDSFTASHRLPEKVFLVHQFRRSMVRQVAQVQRRPHLALVQHVDGYGTPGEKLATYRSVARPDLFTEGFKLFYDADRPLMSAAQVLAVRPRVDFVSFQ
ncbi:hypothetical protein GCM10011519_11570 [Marmoricola endophyticus]|uniref:Lipoprotein n=1 Tax=Marmoricola endophyticus TaxID=2040280 RepID=A0A917BHP1_9ACTN|nr:hypothetical protein [Marmoricola endophyticus]GGF39623.1 hypothetical protein GCM10011519_11570 [Marmoricola endophyticus]